MMFLRYLHRRGSMQGCPSRLQGQMSSMPKVSIPRASASTMLAGGAATAGAGRAQTEGRSPGHRVGIKGRAGGRGGARIGC